MNTSANQAKESREERPPIAKALILSGLVFPGLGQYSQGKKLLGVLIMLLMAWCIYVVFSEAYAQINDAAARMAQSGTVDIMRAQDESQKIMANLSTPRFLIASYGIVVLWIFSITEVFRRPKKEATEQDKRY